MKADAATGSVAALWRFPVKSMRGEQLAQAEITARGLPGDRAWALLDVASGKVVSAKNLRLFPDLFACRASFADPPRPGHEGPPVRIELPDGTTVSSDANDVDARLSENFGREVKLERAAPADYTIDMYHPDVEDLNPAGHRDTVVEQKLGAAFYAEAGVRSPVAPGAFFDLFPLSLLTTSTLDELTRIQPASRFDARRFRMNVIVATDQRGLLENDWIEHELRIGDAVRIAITMPDPRCVMTTLAQEDLPRDIEILRTLTRHNRLQVGDAGRFPCAGVYAVVTAPGTVHTGDRVVLC